MDLFLLLIRYAVDLLLLVLLYDFISQPFRVYGMDPLTRFVWSLARKVCAPFEVPSRMLLRLPDRDLTPIFTAALLVVVRGALYGAAIAASAGQWTGVLGGVILSVEECLSRILIVGLLLVVYADIQLAQYQTNFTGNIPVLMIHDVAKRFVLAIRKVLPSYRPLHVFIGVFVCLALVEGLVLVLTLVPLQATGLLGFVPRVILPPAALWVPQVLGVAGVLMPFVAGFLWLANTYIFAIFVLLLMNMITGLTGRGPYDQTALMLSLVVSPWVQFSRRMFPFAQVGMIDFSVAILLMMLWFLMGLFESVIWRLLGSF